MTCQAITRETEGKAKQSLSRLQAQGTEARNVPKGRRNEWC